MKVVAISQEQLLARFQNFGVDGATFELLTKWCVRSAASSSVEAAFTALIFPSPPIATPASRSARFTSASAALWGAGRDDQSAGAIADSTKASTLFAHLSRRWSAVKVWKRRFHLVLSPLVS